MATTTTTYDVHETRRGVPVTVVPEREEKYVTIKGGGCLSSCAIFQILLGLAVIALEAACVGLCIYLEESAVGIWVGIFAVITGIVGMIAGAKKHSTKVRRCIFITSLLFMVVLAAKAFAFFCASAALLSYAVDELYYFRNGGQFGGGYGGYRYPTFYASGSFGISSSYVCQDYYSSYYTPLETRIGLKATLMILYLILFLTAVIAAALSCVNCCRRRRRKQQVVMTVYPNGKPTVVQHQV